MQFVETDVKWRQGPVCFNLHSTDESILTRATQVMSYWHCDNGSVPTRFLELTAAKVGTGFQFSTGSREAVTYRDLQTLMRALETESAMFLLDQTDLLLTVHGALLERAGQGVLLVGPSNAGKSTTSCALWSAGWRLLADDVTVIDTAEGTAQPVLRRVSLRHPSRHLLGRDFWDRMTSAVTCDPTPEGYIFHPEEVDGISRAGTVPLAAIVFLNRQGTTPPPPATLAPITPATALLSLCPYTNVVRNEGMGEAMQRLGGIVASTRFYDMGRGPLTDMVGTLNRLVGHPA